MEDNRLRIGELTRRAGVTQRTVRYYESIALIPSGEREGNSQHYYPEETVNRLRKINQLKKLGLSLDEIRGIVELHFVDPSGRQSKQKALTILRQHLEETEQKLNNLEQFREELHALIGHLEQQTKSGE